MPKYRATYTLVDDLSPTPSTRQKSFIGDFADYAAASAAELQLRTDLGGVIESGIAKVELAEVTVLTPTIVAGANNFIVGSMTLPINAIKNANMQLPAITVGMQQPGNTLDTAFAAYQTFVDNFITTGGWEISDGEHVDTAFGYGTGKKISVRSGKNFS